MPLVQNATPAPVSCLANRVSGQKYNPDRVDDSVEGHPHSQVWGGSRAFIRRLCLKAIGMERKS